MTPIRLLAVLAAAALAAAAAPATEADAVLWDLLVSLEVENSPVPGGHAPIVSGAVTDHAGKPIEGVSVTITTSDYTIVKATGPNGTYRHDFAGAKFSGGDHIVNAVARLEGTEKKGVAGAVYVIDGGKIMTRAEKVLASPEASRYLSASPEDFDGDPVGTALYNYYQEALAQRQREMHAASEAEERRLHYQANRDHAQNITRQIIEEKNPGAGTFSGIKYDSFVSKLDPSIRESAVAQLNYTRSAFEQAQAAMEEVLESGGTYAEAMKAYHEKASISRSAMEGIITVPEKLAVADANATAANATAVNSTAIAARSAAADAGDILLANQTASGAGAPAYGMLISADPSGWSLPPPGTYIDLKGKAVGLSPSGNVLVSVNGTLVEVVLGGITITGYE